MVFFKTFATMIKNWAAPETYIVLPCQVPFLFNSICFSMFNAHFSETGCKGKNICLMGKKYLKIFFETKFCFDWKQPNRLKTAKTENSFSGTTNEQSYLSSSIAAILIRGFSHCPCACDW
jgi:hypothetical protein